VFQDGAGKYWATVCGSDRYAAVRDRAGIVPLEWITHVGFESWPPPGILRAHPLKVFTERGPWHKLLPLFVKTGSYFQDQHLTQGPDGYFYASGSMCGEPNAGKMPIYRSRDLKEWEEILVRTFDDDEELTPEAKQTPQRVKGEDQWSRYYMSTKINWVPKLKTFAINYETLTTPGTSGTLLSTTGRGEGPYKRVAPGFNCGWFFQDDNDEFYMAWGVNGLFKLNDDFKVAKGLPGPRPPSGTAAFEDCSCGMVKMFGKYIFMTITCGNEAWLKPAVEYGAAYLQSDRPEGPWGEWMPGPRHCAWGYAFRGLDGHWYSSLKSIGSCAGLPVRCIYMVRLKTELRDGQVFMDIDDDWTPDDYQPVTEWKGQGEYSPYTDTAPGPKKK